MSGPRLPMPERQPGRSFFHSLLARIALHAPRALLLTAGEYDQVQEDYRFLLDRHGGNGRTHEVLVDTLGGVPLVVVPFEGDILYQQLRALASLVGVPVDYPLIEERGSDWYVPLAEFVRDGAGWRFIWGPYCTDGASALFPIHAAWPWPKLPAAVREDSLDVRALHF